MGSTPTRSQFFSYHSFFFFPYFSLFCIFFSPPFFLSSSNFFLPFSIPFLLLVTFFLTLSAAFLSLFPPFFYSPDFPLLFLSHCFFLFCFFSHLNFFLVSPLYQGGCYEHKGNNNKRLVVPNISPTSLP